MSVKQQLCNWQWDLCKILLSRLFDKQTKPHLVLMWFENCEHTRRCSTDLYFVRVCVFLLQKCDHRSETEKVVSSFLQKSLIRLYWASTGQLDGSLVTQIPSDQQMQACWLWERCLCKKIIQISYLSGTKSRIESKYCEHNSRLKINCSSHSDT